MRESGGHLVYKWGNWGTIGWVLPGHLDYLAETWTQASEIQGPTICLCWTPVPPWSSRRNRQKLSSRMQSGLFLASTAPCLRRWAGMAYTWQRGWHQPDQAAGSAGRGSPPLLFVHVISINQITGKIFLIDFEMKYIILLLFLVFYFIYFCYSIHSRANFLIMFFLAEMKMEMKWVFILQVSILYRMGSWDDDR